MKLIKTFESFLTEKEPTIKPFMVDEPIDNDIDTSGEIDHDDHHEVENYMFFGNLETIKRLIDDLLLMDPIKVDELLKKRHNWAEDHIATSKDDVQEVYDFFKGEMTEKPSKISVNESDSLELSGIAKRMYNELKREGKSVTMNYQNAEMGKKGTGKNFSVNDGDITISAFPSYIMVLTGSEEEAQDILNRYSTENIIGELKFHAKNYDWDNDRWSANFTMKPNDQRKTFSVNKMAYEPRPNSNDRSRQSKPTYSEYMAESSYSCNECGASYEATSVNEGDSCGCGGKLTKN